MRGRAVQDGQVRPGPGHVRLREDRAQVNRRKQLFLSGNRAVFGKVRMQGRPLHCGLPSGRRLREGIRVHKEGRLQGNKER